ncbi:MAG TPA: hypothetical protein VF079_05465 [Sphingomicrobium sp.]
MATATAGAQGPERSRGRPRKSPFFALLGLLMLVLAIGGFWPQYFSAVTGRTPSPTTQFWLIHLHAALFSAWLLLYIFQAGLIATGRARTHFALGPWFAAYGFAIVLVGVYAAGRLAHRLGVREHDADAAASFIFFPLLDMAFLGGFLAAALVYRKRQAVHKRAMFLATFSIAVVGIGRLVFRTGIESVWLWQPMVLTPVLAAIAYDWLVCRKLFPIMMVGLLVHILRLNAEQFTASEAWLPVGRILVAPFG